MQPAGPTGPTVAIDVQPLVSTGGIATYTRNLLTHLQGVGIRPVFAAVRGLERVEAALSAALRANLIVPPLAWRLAHHSATLAERLPGFERVAGGRSERPDLLHGPNFFVPHSDLPAVVTVHDLTALRFPQWHTATVRQKASRLGRSAHEARLTIVDSEATASDVIELLGLPAERIRVVPLAADPLPDDAAANPGIDRPYVLHVGALEPRKNLVRLISAFKAAVGASSEHALVLAGPEAWGAAEVRAAAAGDSRIRILGDVDRRQLAALYRNAACFAYPSHFEGFGLPVLEAMACGAPVVASTGGSLPEVVGDAGLTVEPSDEKGLTQAIAQVLFEPGVAADLSLRGRERATQFSWGRTAELTRQAYLEAL